MDNTKNKNDHPSESFLRPDIFPTVWCAGCGIGTAVYSVAQASQEAGISQQDLRVISGVGCTGKIAECLQPQTYSIVDGNIMDYAVKLKQKEPDAKICVFLNNADLFVTGAAGLIKAGKEQAELTVIVFNNCIYTVSRDQAFPLTPFIRKSANNEHELPFNIPHMAVSVGAAYVARWTPLRTGWLKNSLQEAFSISGLSVIEMLSPCLIFEGNSGRLLDTVERMEFFNENSVIDLQVPTERLDLRLQKKIIIGTFKSPLEATVEG